MHIMHGILHLIWHIVSLPFHLLATLIKIFIVGPIVAILVIAGLIFLCLALVFPASLSAIHIQPPDLVGIFTSQVQHVAVPGSGGQPAAVTSAIQGKAIVVSWSGDPNGAQWYEVLRKTVQDPAWRRIALVPAENATGDHYEYTDASVQKGITYHYAVSAVTTSGGEGERVESTLQVVAP